MSTARFHRESEEDFGVHLRKLWKAESGYREFPLFSGARLEFPPPLQFSGGSLHHPENPKPALRYALFFHPRHGLVDSP
jgi:hypothetical protein